MAVGAPGVANASPLPSSCGNAPPGPESHDGASPVSSSCSLTNAMFPQLSRARPRLLIPAARKWKTGAMSGVHISRLN